VDDDGIARQQLLVQMAAALELLPHDGLRLEYCDIEFEAFANVQDVRYLPPRLDRSAAVGRSGLSSNDLIHMTSGADLQFINAVTAVGGSLGGWDHRPHDSVPTASRPMAMSASKPMAAPVDEPVSLPVVTLVPTGGKKMGLSESPASSFTKPVVEATNDDDTRLSAMTGGCSGDWNGGKGGRRGGKGSDSNRSNRIFVGKVDYQTTQGESILLWHTRDPLTPPDVTDGLADYFAQFGHVVDAYIPKERDTRHSRGFGFVTFDNRDAVQRVVAFTGAHTIDGRQVESVSRLLFLLLFLFHTM
jgi:hypothetical protein